MKRKGYASAELVKKVKELKKEGVYQFMLTAYIGASQKTAFRKTANGISAWANEIIAKYGVALVTVEYLDKKDWTMKTLTTYC